MDMDKVPFDLSVELEKEAKTPTKYNRAKEVKDFGEFPRISESYIESSRKKLEALKKHPSMRKKARNMVLKKF